MELPDWVADVIVAKDRTITESSILVLLFRRGQLEGDFKVWRDGVNALVPTSSEDALDKAVKRLEKLDYLRTETGHARPGRRGRPPRVLISPVGKPGVITPNEPLQMVSQGNSAGYSESEGSRVRARVPFAAAAADPLYPALVRVFRIEGVVDPETQVSAFGIRASLAAVSELRVRRLTGMAVSTKPRNLLCHFGEKYRTSPPDVPNPDVVLGDWDSGEFSPRTLRAVK